MIYFLKPVNGQTESTIYSSQSLTSYSKCQAHILFLHAITGCDTTSALYQRVQAWLGNELNPEGWGWVFKDNGLEPIQTLLPPALEKLLNTIFLCNNCRGQSFSNVEPNTADNEVYDEAINDESDETLDSSFLLNQPNAYNTTRE
ncbi:Uncharacterized protein FWK35_00028423 [Aphis craccivora]|uniref:Uncharacterized protein n=1 Tax=Aphis craccivora TaxID=307492 RepID=A0A6G0XSF1_APHCR|nr:Uncharacterized protein FWK35_00028423 [Aphis craccivora]